MSNNNLAMLGVAAAAASASLYITPSLVTPPAIPPTARVVQTPPVYGAAPSIAPAAAAATAPHPSPAPLSGSAVTRDNRQFIDEDDRKNGFARFVCQVWADDPGSGVLLSPQHVLTAAHNLYTSNGSLSDSVVKVRPGFDNRDDINSIRTRYSSHWILQSAYKDSMTRIENLGDDATEDDERLRWSFDVAVLVLDHPFDDIDGPFPRPAAFGDFGAGGGVFRLNGYDAMMDRYGYNTHGMRQVTRTLSIFPKQYNSRWFMLKSRRFPVSTHISLYESPEAYTSAGASGGPVWFVKDNQPWVVGIHTGGFQKNGAKGARGVLFDDEYVRWLNWALQQTP